ncbi:hypothetical protein AX14_002155 [Amanita brunnescens Koide BX004]|nr:hypothetical protein AX14_002155 [Amanita brunnescens Koide BX004]
MTDNFNTNAASVRLEKFAIKRAQFHRAGIQLAELTKLKNWTSSYRVYQSNTEAKTWHIVHSKDNIELVDPSKLEELVTSIQGIIWKHDLPPFTQQIHVMLTGLGMPIFEKGVQALLDVQAFFEHYIPANKLDECTIIEKCDTALGIHVSNRHFTPRQEAPAEEAIPFSAEVDPSGLLAALVGDQFFHSEQNVVKYNSREVVEGGAIRYRPIPLVRFRIGDIVEAKATLMLIPLRQGHFKLTAVLRSLTLLDTSFAQTSVHASNIRIKKLMQSTMSPLKRSITFEEEEDTVPQKKIASGIAMESSTSSATKTTHSQMVSKVATKELEGRNSENIDMGRERAPEEPMVIDN